MAKLNLNKLAKAVSEREGGKQNLSIAQVKEVIKHTLNELALAQPSQVLAALESR